MVDIRQATAGHRDESSPDSAKRPPKSVSKGSNKKTKESLPKSPSQRPAEGSSEHPGKSATAKPPKDLRASVAEHPATGSTVPEPVAGTEAGQPVLVALEPTWLLSLLQPRMPRGWDRRAFGQVLILLAVLDLASLASSLWVAQAVSLLLVLTLPGALMLRALRLPASRVLAAPHWVLATSITLLMLLGLGLDLGGEWLEHVRPLTPVTVVVVVNVLVALLASLPGRWTPYELASSLWAAIDRRALLSLLLPLAASLGALRLNAVGDSSLAIVSVATACGLLAVSLLRAPRWTDQRICWVLLSVTAALLLGFSLRSSYVFGWDISSEYAIMNATIEAQGWGLSHPGDAYGAMVSLTVFPAALNAVTGLSAVMLLKLIYPLLFAVFPVTTYIVLRRVLGRRAAVFGAGLLLMQQSMLQELPAIGRQEVALLLFGVLLTVLVDRRGPRGALGTLIVMLCVSTMLAHYSTTYTLITILALAVPVQFVIGRWHHARVFDKRVLLALVTSVAAAWLWYSVLTRSASNLSNLVQGLLESGVQLLPNGDGSSLLSDYLQGNVTAPMTVQAYQSGVTELFRVSKPWVNVLPAATDPQWVLAPTPDDSPALPTTVDALVAFATVAFSQFVNVVATGGTVVVLLSRRVRQPLLRIATLALPAVALLAAVRLSGELASRYGQGRLLVQLLPVIAAPLLWLLVRWERTIQQLVKRAGRTANAVYRRALRPAVLLGLGAVLVLQVADTAGLMGAQFGVRDSANLYNSGEHYDRFYVVPQEVSAAQWLGQHQAPRDLVYADPYGQLRLYGYGKTADVTMLDSVIPETVDVNGWVYASRVNVDGQGRGVLDGNQVWYQYPAGFLTDQLGIAYSNGTAEVFHR